MKLKLDFVEIWCFNCLSDFTWNQILVHSNGPKMSFLANLDTLNFDFSKFEQLSSPKFTKNSKFIVAKLSKILKNDAYNNLSLSLLHSVKICEFYCQSDFTWNQILVHLNGPKMSFLPIYEVLNFDFSTFEQLSSPNFSKNLSSEFLKLPKMTFLDHLNWPKFDFS